MLRKLKGFTIIELVIVIVILGILAAFAVPKFINIATQARVNSIEALKGNVTAAATLARSAQEVESKALGTSVDVSGTTIGMSAGYPTALGASNMMQDLTGYTVTTSEGVTTFALADAPTSSTCKVVYTEATSDYAFPVIQETITGCSS